MVQAGSAEPEPGEIRLTGRAMFNAVVMNHPAGTLVTSVIVGRLANLPPSVSQ